MRYTWLVLILAGGFAIAGGLCNWDWFMNNSRARGFVELFGREGARVFYVLLGVLSVILGVVLVVWK